MKIMMLIFSFNVGGIERLLVDEMNGLVQRRHEMTLCVINDDVTESLIQTLSPEVSVVRLGRKPGTGKAEAMRQISKVISDRKIEILHCQGMNCVLMAGLAKIQHPHLVVLNTVHDVGNYPSYSNAEIFISNRILSMTVAISESVRKEILQRHVRSDRVVTIHNAIDTDRFHYVKRHHTGSSFRIVNVARFYPKKKGQDTLCRAMESLLERFPNLVCIFAGAPAKGQEEAYKVLQKSIEARGLASHFQFLGNVDDVPALLASADLFVLPSNYEGFGISLIEAMASGLPCVASDLQGPREIMTGAEEAGVHAGVLVPAGDSDALASAIASVLTSYDSYSGREISDYTRETYSMRAFVDAHEKLYASLLKR